MDQKRLRQLAGIEQQPKEVLMEMGPSPENVKDLKIRQVFTMLRRGLEDARRFSEQAKQANTQEEAGEIWEGVANDLMNDVREAIEIFDR